MSVSDSQIDELVTAIKAATAAGQWSVVKALNVSLRSALDARRRHMAGTQKRALRQTNGSKSAHQALMEGRPAGPLLAAFASDPRFGSLRAYAESRGIDRSSLSAYARGVSPCPVWVDRLIRRDFPDLEWVWPRGLAE